MMCHYPALGSASDWLRQISLDARPIRSTTQIWVVLLIVATRHGYGIFWLVCEMSLCEETSSIIMKCQLFSQACCPLGSTKDVRCYPSPLWISSHLFSSRNRSISQAKWLSISPSLMLVPHIGQQGV